MVEKWRLKPTTIRVQHDFTTLWCSIFPRMFKLWVKRSSQREQPWISIRCPVHCQIFLWWSCECRDSEKRHTAGTRGTCIIQQCCTSIRRCNRHHNIGPYFQWDTIRESIRNWTGALEHRKGLDHIQYHTTKPIFFTAWNIIHCCIYIWTPWDLSPCILSVGKESCKKCVVKVLVGMIPGVGEKLSSIWRKYR